jgi:hypothetical protein
LGENIFFKRGQTTQLNSQTIKYERTKWGKKKDIKKYDPGQSELA